MEYNWITEKWIKYYMSIYPYSLPFVCIIFWFWITHVDRVHLREKARNLGWKIQDKINKELPDKNQLMIDYCYKQVNAMGEIVAGISDGLLNKKSSINICVIQNNDSQTEYETISEEIQTEQIATADAMINVNIKELETETKETVKLYEVSSDNSSQSSVDNKINKINKKRKKRIFTTTKTILDTEVFEKDIEEEKKIQPMQKKRIISL